MSVINYIGLLIEWKSLLVLFIVKGHCDLFSQKHIHKLLMAKL